MSSKGKKKGRARASRTDDANAPSAATSTVPAANADGAGAGGETPGAPARPKRRRRWLRRTLVVALVLVVALRVALPSIVASAASSWAQGQGLELTFEEIDFGLASGRVGLWGVDLSKDGDRQIRIETLDLDLDMRALFGGDVVVRRAEIDGVDARLERGADGALTLFADAPPAIEEPDEPEEEADARAQLTSLALPFAVHAARVQRVSLEWTDGAVDPPIELNAELDLAISDLGVEGVPARARLRFAAPGAIEQIALDASLDARGDSLTADVVLAISGIDGSAATAYLASLGLEPPDRSQDLRIEATADLALESPDALRGTVALTQSVGRGSGATRAGATRTADTWLELAAVEANFEPDARGTRIDLVAQGLALEAERAIDGRLVLAGFTIGGQAETPVASAPEESANESADGTDTAPVADATPVASAIRVGTIAVRDASIALVDRAVRAEPLRSTLLVHTIDLDLEGADGGLDATIDLASPDVFDSLQIEAALGDGGGRATLAFGGLTLAGVAPYLAPADMEPTGASCALELAVEFATGADGTSAEVTQLAMIDGPRTPLTLERLTYRDASGVLSATLDGLLLRAVSEAPGSTSFGPLRLGRLAEASTDTASANRTSTTAPQESTGTAAGPVPVDVELRVDAIVRDVTVRDVTGGGATGTGPGTIEASLAAPGIVESARIEGTVLLADGGVDATATIAVEGLRERALVARRPVPEAPARGARAALAVRVGPTTAAGRELRASVRELDLDGRFAADEIVFEGQQVAPDAQGTAGLTGALRASGLVLPMFELEGGTLALDVDAARTPENVALKIDAFSFGDANTSLQVAAVEFLSRTRADGGTTIESAAVRGVEIDARRRADGALVVAGLMLVPPTPAADAAAASTGGAGAQPGSAAGSTPAPAPVEPAPTPEPAPAAERPRPESRLALDSLAIEIARLELVDEANGTAARARFALENAAPSVLYDPDGDATPLELRLTGAVEPGLGDLVARIVADPDEGGIGLVVELDANGLSDAGWIAAWPDLAATLEPGGVEDGALSMRLDARLDAPRTSAIGFDLRRLVDATVELKDVAFTPRADTDEGFALESLRAQVRSLGSDMSPLRLGDVEIGGARLSVVSSPASMAVAGVRLRTPDTSDDAGAAPQSSDQSADQPAARSNATANGTGDEPAGGGIVIDRLVWTGLDLSYVDTTTTPTTRLPIDTLDIDARNVPIGTTGRRPIQFRASLRGAAVDLPDLPPRRNILAGIAQEITGGAERTRSERRWVDELILSGNLQPGDALEGWARAELYGFELTALEGLGEGGGVEIGAGSVDTNVRIDFRGAQGQRIKSRTTFTSLSVSEPPGGPISRFLRLPAPLDVVLWVLRNERGEHVVPLSFSLDDAGVSTSELISQGTQALVKLITDALASSPLRLGGGLLDIVGLDPFGRGDAAAPVGRVVDVRYGPGDTRIDAVGKEALTEVLRMLAADDTVVFRVAHLFSEQDVERALELAIPDPDASRSLSARIESERDEVVQRLAFERERLARLVATGSTDDADTLASALRLEAARLDGLERALDTLYGLSVPADDRTQKKRLRAASLRLAERRFEAVVRELFERGASDAVSRLQFMRPSASDVDTEEGAVGRLVFTPRGR